MLSITLKQKKDVNWYDKLLISWFDSKREEIVLLIDSQVVVKNLPRVFMHEYAHWRIWKRLGKHRILYFTFGLLLEEPFVWWYQRNL